MIPTPFPSKEEWEHARKVLATGALAVYQRFYYAGLTSANTRRPYRINFRFVEGPLALMGFTATHESNPELSCFGKDAEELFERARMLREAWDSGRSRPSHRACCILAEFTHCVCTESFACPIHGQTHHGTHD
ncbi:MAG: hypothetical protein KGL39_30950 [Patescibacteria group bacterium]|nr:hypothetical protein [Patescibacteria group bacterium]